MKAICPYCDRTTPGMPCVHCGATWGEFQAVRAAHSRQDGAVGTYVRAFQRPSLTGEHPGRKGDVERDANA